ncbi:MAG: OprD family outer membrane porin, partial [Sulfuricurvum sp.]
MTKLSIATALILGTTVVATAADVLTDALVNGKMEKRLRVQYFNTDWDNNGATGKNGSDANGLAVGGSLIYKTDPLYGISVGAGLYTTQNPMGRTDSYDGATATTSKDLFSRNSSRSATGSIIPVSYGKGYAVLAQAYVQYDIAKTKAKGGRMLMSNPWISPNDTKMIPIAIEGYEAISNDILNTTIQLDYADKIKERGMTYFGSMADTGDTPDKIAAYYSTHYATVQGTHGDAPGVAILGIKNKSIDNLELQAWGMHWNDIVDEGIVEANYALEAGDAIVSFGGRYIIQRDKGAGNIIVPKSNNFDTDNSIDTSLYAFRTSVNYRAAKLTLATSHTASGGDLIAPWRGFPTDGYTRSMTQTDWNADTRA